MLKSASADFSNKPPKDSSEAGSSVFSASGAFSSEDAATKPVVSVETSSFMLKSASADFSNKLPNEFSSDSGATEACSSGSSSSPKSDEKASSTFVPASSVFGATSSGFSSRLRSSDSMASASSEKSICDVGMPFSEVSPARFSFSVGFSSGASKLSSSGFSSFNSELDEVSAVDSSGSSSSPSREEKASSTFVDFLSASSGSSKLSRLSSLSSSFSSEIFSSGSSISSSETLSCLDSSSSTFSSSEKWEKRDDVTGSSSATAFLPESTTSRSSSPPRMPEMAEETSEEFSTWSKSGISEPSGFLERSSEAKFRELRKASIEELSSSSVFGSDAARFAKILSSPLISAFSASSFTSIVNELSSIGGGTRLACSSSGRTSYSSFQNGSSGSISWTRRKQALRSATLPSLS